MVTFGMIAKWSPLWKGVERYMIVKNKLVGHKPPLNGQSVTLAPLGVFVKFLPYIVSIAFAIFCHE